MSLGCKVCDDKAAALTIDRYLEQDLNYSTIARSLTLGGFPVSAPTISAHDKHRAPSVDPRIGAGKRDAAKIIKGKVLDALEKVGEAEDNDGTFILNAQLQPALATALKAQAIEDKREQTKANAGVTFVLQLAAALGERLALPDPNVVEGHAVEVLD